MAKNVDKYARNEEKKMLILNQYYFLCDGSN